MNNGNYEFDPCRVKDAHEWCQKTTKILLNNERSVIVANTFTRIWEMQAYFDMASELNIKCCVYRMMTQYDNIHNVSSEVIERMRARFEDYPGENLVKQEDDMARKSVGIDLSIPENMIELEIDHQKKVKKVLDLMRPDSLEVLMNGDDSIIEEFSKNWDVVFNQK